MSDGIIKDLDKFRKEFNEVLGELDKLMTIRDANTDAIRETINSTSERLEIPKKTIREIAKAYHKGDINSVKDSANNVVDIADILYGEEHE